MRKLSSSNCAHNIRQSVWPTPTSDLRPIVPRPGWVLIAQTEIGHGRSELEHGRSEARLPLRGQNSGRAETKALPNRGQTWPIRGQNSVRTDTRHGRGERKRLRAEANCGRTEAIIGRTEIRHGRGKPKHLRPKANFCRTEANFDRTETRNGGTDPQHVRPEEPNPNMVELESRPFALCRRRAQEHAHSAPAARPRRAPRLQPPRLPRQGGDPQTDPNRGGSHRPALQARAQRRGRPDRPPARPGRKGISSAR